MSAEVSALFGDVGLASGVLPLLGMGRDIPDGKMSLADGRLQVDWSKHGASEDYFDRVRDLSRRIAEELGGDFHDDPLWYLNRVITVHSLGGCPMGRSEEEGVVDERGEVFNHPGLHVADGSVMPGPVGREPEPDDRGARRPLRRRDHRAGNATRRRARPRQPRSRAEEPDRRRAARGRRTRRYQPSPSPRR